MGATTQDILVDIPDQDLPKLAKMYETHVDRLPHAYSAIKNGIEWKRKEKNCHLTFMSPNNCWKEDGTFFALLQYFSFDIIIFTLDETGRNVYEALIHTKRLQDPTYLDRQALFYCVNHNIYPIVKEAMKVKNMEITVEVPCFSYNISKDEAIKFNIECPPDVYIKELDATHATTVNEAWPHRYKNSERLVAFMISMNGGYGVFLKSNDELVSWINISMLGQLALLQTKAGHFKKGYASLVTKYLSKKLAEKGYNPFGTVVLGNAASSGMFQKLGFRSLGVSTYALYKNG